MMKNNNLKKEAEIFFNKRIRSTYYKKKPYATQYPYNTFDSYKIFGENSGFECFHLVGDNWNESKKPIAILWGFNNWKFGFVADYLTEYRVAFCSRRMPAIKYLAHYIKMKIKPECFIVWGFTYSTALTAVSKVVKLPIYRMEDGFIRSAALGASHSTPYSLVLDKKGIHYDCNKQSDLEEILNTFDFENNKNLTAAANICIHNIISRKLSKYNMPAINNKNLNKSIPIRKRVAVLGQVDSDASIRYGNPQGWSTESLLKLAAFQNPEADIIYRPHPEVYQGYQKSKFKARRINNIAKISSPDEPFAEFISQCDHVYTISSLTGFEALIRGIKVTTVGAPFYSGWGLTDDHVKIKRRKAKLSVEQLFAGAYLIYPRYLANISESISGFNACFLKIIADRNIHKNILSRSLINNNIDKTTLSTTDLVNLLFSNDPNKIDLYFFSNIKKIELHNFFLSFPTPLCREILLFHCIGLTTKESDRSYLLTITRELLPLDNFENLLALVQNIFPGKYIYIHLSWILEQQNKNADAINLMEVISYEQQTENYFTENEDEKLNAIQLSQLPDRSVIHHLYQNFVDNKQYSSAIYIAKIMFLFGLGNQHILLNLAAIAKLSFDLKSSFFLGQLAFIIDPYSLNKKAITVCSENIIHAGLKPEENLDILITDYSLKPERVVTNLNLIKENPSLFNLSYHEALDYFIGMSQLTAEISIPKTMCYLELGNTQMALSTIRKIIDGGTYDEKVSVTYSKVLTACGKHSKALSTMKQALSEKVTALSVTELLRIQYALGHFKDSLELIDLATSKGVKISSTLKIGSLQGVGKIKEAYDHYLDMPFRETLIKYFPKKYFRELPIKSFTYNLVIAAFGPGDEIRFASIYNDINNYYNTNKLTFTCDVRLFSLFKRSFPEIDFLPVQRARSYNDKNNYSTYNLLPGSDLCSILDNGAIDTLAEADKINLVTDFISLLRPDKKSFCGPKNYLKTNHKTTNLLRKKLPKGILIGLSWRSSLVNFSRNTHYLTIEELEPIFSLEGITFVNLQYDDCSTELAWVEKKFPGKVINLDSVDQYNDFDTTASLIECLDLVISPATSVAELSGALGTNTWLLSNDAGLHWRKINSHKVDIWHSQMTHIESKKIGDKQSLVENLKHNLKRFILYYNKKIPNLDTINNSIV